MKTVHTELLQKFAGVLNEMSLLCDSDSEFEDLLCTLNYNQTVFSSSIDEMACEVESFIEDEIEKNRPSFEFNGMNITNPFYSECLRFEVDPIEYYGLTKEELSKYEQV